MYKLDSKQTVLNPEVLNWEGGGGEILLLSSRPETGNHTVNKWSKMCSCEFLHGGWAEVNEQWHNSHAAEHT